MNKKLWKIKEIVQQAVAPSDFRCVNCGVDVFDELGFCKNCLKDVKFNNGKTCKRCGVALYGEEEYCGHCAFERIWFDRAYSPFCYDGAVQSALLKMKFGHLAVNAKIFARYLAYVAQRENLQFDIVTFVPMRKKAEKIRGYNQAELLAKYFCDILSVEDKFTPTLTKVKDTARQETLNKAERKENLAGAFSSIDVKGKSVLLIDDIKTTGSTLNECAKALKKKGATQVVCLTVASREETLSFELEAEIEM